MTLSGRWVGHQLNDSPPTPNMKKSACHGNAMISVRQPGKTVPTLVGSSRNGRPYMSGSAQVLAGLDAGKEVVTRAVLQCDPIQLLGDRLPGIGVAGSSTKSPVAHWFT